MTLRTIAGAASAAISLSLLAASAAELVPDVKVTDDEIVVRLSFPAPEFERIAEGTVPVVGQLPSLAETPGHPILPVASYTLALPPGRSPEAVRLAGSPTVLDRTIRVAWGREPRPVGQPPLPASGPDPAVYGSGDPYPRQPARISGSGSFRGYKLATITVHPLQVRPLSGELWAWGHLEARIRLVPAADAPLAAPRGLQNDIDELARVVLNPETAFSHGRPEAGRTADVPYLIVTAERLRAPFERLLAHRGAHGLNGELVTIEAIDEGYAGRDRAEKLRNAIAERYEQHGTSFALLGGDDVDDEGQALIPIRHCPGADNTPSDYYFGALDGDWDGDGDGTFCEPEEVDYYAEVHIGRATVDTAEEADRWIDKLIAYESGLSEQRRCDIVLMGETLDDSTWGDDAMEETAALIDENEYDVERLFARPETFQYANVMASLHRGPHLTNHLGHAGANYVMGIGISDVEALANETPFFSYSQGCYAGAFDQGVSGNEEAISEHFLSAEHAAFGVVMNGRYGWYCVGWPYCLSQRYAHEFFDAIFTEGLGTLGEANDDSREDNAGSAQTDGTSRYCFLETNLHGDPATPIQARRTALRYATHRVIDGDPAYANANGIADPGETVKLAISLINEGSEPAQGIDARLSSSTPGVSVHDHWARWDDIPAGEAAENVSEAFTVTLDIGCGERPAFRLEVRHDDALVDVSVFELVAGLETEIGVFEDDFESDRGWAVGGSPTGGAFVRQDPHGVTDGWVGPVQPEEDVTDQDAALCWVTGNPSVGGGFDPRAGDLDNGTTYIVSPVFDGTGEGRLQARFWRWFHRTAVAYLNEGSYRARVSNDGGQSWIDL
ncbi:MAG: hypothetical protein JSV80_03855 [Acidobacteriota bacterium]|nr:MAG: hypothetical protein JSV80_03855 [Acidobacteriota bacterium]